MSRPVYELSDADLVRALDAIASRTPQALTEWQRDFASGLTRTFLKRGSITWKQRKTARELVEGTMLRLAQLHNRPDLAPIARAPAPAPGPAVFQLPPQPPPRPPPDPRALLEVLSPTQVAALEILADGLTHTTAARNDATRGRIAGGSVRVLEKRRLIEAHYDTRLGHTKPTVSITPLGREVLRAAVERLLEDRQ